MKLIILFALYLILVGCSSDEDNNAVPTSYISVIGFTDFKDVIIGYPVKSKIILDNPTASPITYSINGSYNFVITPIIQACTNQVPANTKCEYYLQLTPVAKGEIESILSYSNEVKTFKANVISDSKITSNITSVNIGTILAGEKYQFTIMLKNEGDVKSVFPSFSGSTTISIISSNCGVYIYPNEECSVNLEFRTTTRNHNLSTVINYYSGNEVGVITVIGSVLAAEMTGDVQFSTVPASVSADGAEYTVITSISYDEFNNEIEDGTKITVSFYNLNSVLNTPDPIDVFSLNGRFTIPFKSTLTPGTAMISLNNETSSGAVIFTVIP